MDVLSSACMLLKFVSKLGNYLTIYFAQYAWACEPRFALPKALSPEFGEIALDDFRKSACRWILIRFS